MDTKYYTCTYCHKEFVPKRRYVQKYCSNSCRSKAHHQKRKTPALNQPTEMPPVPNKIDSMSVAGIGNAAAGTLAADALKSIFTDRYNKPATKGDLIALGNKIQRFQLVKNLAPGIGGALPYFDMETKNIVYRNHNDLIP